ISKLSLIFKRKKWVYQIQDIRSIYFGNGIRNKVARLIERIFLNTIDILVLSSPEYFTRYYWEKYKFNASRVVVIENKLIKGSIDPKRTVKEISKEIVIGYFGVMRCHKSWEVLKELFRIGSG